jgi:hypothetical protein
MSGRGRRRGRKARKTGRGDRTGKVTEVRVIRSPKGTGRPAKVRRDVRTLGRQLAEVGLAD